MEAAGMINSLRLFCFFLIVKFRYGVSTSIYSKEVAAMIACSVQQITKMYGGNIIFDQLSFDINEKERVGLVGRNGSGKTALLKLLAGEETPDSGVIHWRKDCKTGYVKQIPDFASELIVEQMLRTAFSELLGMEERMKQLEQAMGMETNDNRMQQLLEKYGQLQEQFLTEGGYEIESKMKKVVNGLNMNELLEKPFSALSGGEKTKAGLAFALLQNPGLLLLDEPTNHLDFASVEWLGGFLHNYSGTIVVVSHDRYFLDQTVNKILDLEDGTLEEYNANYTGYVKEKEERLLREFEAYKEQQKKIKKMQEAIKRLREWANRANPPNEGLHKRARNMERALERMEKLSRPVLERKKIQLKMEAADRSGKDVIQLKEVSKRFGEQLLFEDVNMNLTYKQRAAIVGENGTGKSTMVKLILQQLESDTGEIRVGSNVKIGYLSQHVFADTANETVLDVFRSEVEMVEGQARQVLARFLFYGYAVFKKVSQLSGGEKMRLRLAQLMYQDTNLLLLDEPTNHLDIESLEVLEETLEQYNGTILGVSHDRYFLDKLFEKIYWISSNTVRCFEGNYSWARERMERDGFI